MTRRCLAQVRAGAPRRGVRSRRAREGSEAPWLKRRLPCFTTHPSPRSPCFESDAEVVRDTYRFVRDEEDDAALRDRPSERALAERYYARLFKEYVVADLSAAEAGTVGMRWRTSKEVIEGRGQFTCGVRGCYAAGAPLRSYELHFAYADGGRAREALVKLRCCARCAERLAVARRKESRRQSHKKRRREEVEDGRGDAGNGDVREPVVGIDGEEAVVAADEAEALLQELFL